MCFVNRVLPAVLAKCCYHDYRPSCYSCLFCVFSSFRNISVRIFHFWLHHADGKAKLDEDCLAYDQLDQYPSLENNPVTFELRDEPAIPQLGVHWRIPQLCLLLCSRMLGLEPLMFFSSYVLVDVGGIGFHSLITSTWSSGSDSASCLLCLLMGDGCGTADGIILMFSAKQTYMVSIFILLSHMTWQCFR